MILWWNQKISGNHKRPKSLEKHFNKALTLEERIFLMNEEAEEAMCDSACELAKIIDRMPATSSCLPLLSGLQSLKNTTFRSAGSYDTEPDYSGFSSKAGLCSTVFCEGSDEQPARRPQDGQYHCLNAPWRPD